MELVTGMDFIRDYWWLIIAILALLLAFVLLRPRQRVQLTDSTPVRPHMAARRPEREGRGLAGEAAAATSDVTGELLGAPVHRKLSGKEEPADDFCRMKGVGPKFASLLNDVGITRFEQIARLSEGDLDRLDLQLGPFKGRLHRDQIPLQADYLARGDRDGFEQRFGKL